MKKPCENCGTIFVLRRKDARCCSTRCHIASRRKRPDVREDARLRAKKWNADNIERRREYELRKKKPPRFALCKNCGVKFRVRTNGLYCSVSCRGKHYRKTKPEQYKAMWVRNRPQALAHMTKKYHETRLKAPWKILMAQAKIRAKRDGRSFTIDNAWCETRWTGNCELTGIAFTLGAKGRVAMSPSIDQIRPGEGYTPKNTRFILWALNAAKGRDPEATLYFIAEALTLTRTRSQSVAGILALPG